MHMQWDWTGEHFDVVFGFLFELYVGDTFVVCRMCLIVPMSLSIGMYILIVSVSAKDGNGQGRRECINTPHSYNWSIRYGRHTAITHKHWHHPQPKPKPPQLICCSIPSIPSHMIRIDVGLLVAFWYVCCVYGGDGNRLSCPMWCGWCMSVKSMCM